MNIQQWERKLEQLPAHELADLKLHLQGLQNIPMFADEFQGTGIFALLQVIDWIEKN